MAQGAPVKSASLHIFDIFNEASKAQGARESLENWRMAPVFALTSFRPRKLRYYKSPRQARRKTVTISICVQCK